MEDCIWIIKENNEQQQEWLYRVVSEQIPTGAVSIEGYVYDDKEKSFSLMLDNPKPGKNMGIIMSDPLYEMDKPESETPAKKYGRNS